MYATLDNIKNEETLAKFRDSLQDRFGEIPTSVIQLIDSVRLRWIGERLGFEKISLKNDKFKGQFISGKEEYFKSEIFGKILAFVQANSRRCKLKDANGKFTLTIEKIASVEDALKLFEVF